MTSSPLADDKGPRQPVPMSRAPEREVVPWNPRAAMKDHGFVRRTPRGHRSGWTSHGLVQPGPPISAVLHPPLPTTALRVSPDGSRRVFGRRTDLVLCALVIALTLVVSIGPTGEIFAGEPGPLRGAMLAVAVPGFTLAWRIFRRRVVVDSDLVEVRNLFRTVRCPAHDIASFAPPAPYGRLWRTGLRLNRVQRPPLYCDAMYSNPVSPSYGVDVAAELNAWLDDRRHGRPALPRARNVLGGTTWFLWWALKIIVVVEMTVAVLVLVTGLVDPTFGGR